MFKKKLEEKPLNYWEEKSYMLAIPKEPNDDLLKKSLDRIATIENLEIRETNYNIDGYINVLLTYEDDDYEVGFYLGGISVPEYYMNSNTFTKEERELILSAKRAITIFMEFTSNVKKSYHLQLKLAVALVPDLIGVLDESAERVLSGNWVKLTAASQVLPSSKDFFTVQAVQGKDNKIWLHTHGLNRCHMTELEILESNTETYQNHYNLLTIYAMYVLDKDKPYDPRLNSSFIGRLIDGSPVVATCRSWTEGLGEYKNLSLGGAKDREAGHNTMTSIVFLYTCEEDEKNDKLSKVSVYDELWGDNPLFFFSDEETRRMKDLAIERFDYVKTRFKEGDDVLLKIGLPLPQEGQFEHIWFELLEIKGDKFKAKLTQEPYDVDDIHTGDERWYGLNDLTDWIIYTKYFSINPGNVHLLALLKELDENENAGQ